MANLTTAQDIINSALRRSGEVTDGSSEYDTTAVELLNEIHLDSLSGSNKFDVDFGEAFPWAKEKAPGILTLKPKYTTGTISLTNGSTSGTFSTAPADSKADWFLRVEGDSTLYRLTAHTLATTSFTLDNAYLGSTDTAASFELYKLWYDLEAGVLRLISPMIAYDSQTSENNGTGEVSELPFADFKREWPFHIIVIGTPTKFTRVVHNTNTNVITIRFNKIPSEESRLEYERIKIPTDLTDSSSDIPKTPREYREGLCFGVTHFILLEKNDNRAMHYFNLAKACFMAATKSRRKELGHSSRNFARVIARPDLVRSSRRFFPEDED